jgi:hypothetical protein
MLSLLESQKSTAAGHEFEILPVEELWERLDLFAFCVVRCYEFALRWITILCLDELTHGVGDTTNEFYSFTIGAINSKSYYIDWVTIG